jgi:hypothetical protein
MLELILGGAGGNLCKSSCVFSVACHTNCQADRTKANVMGGACGTYLGEESEINDFGVYI